ncbi:MAG: nucleoside recognition protein [Lachnospiraceae bacterium]|nr:nucleoside recognition protein [Lachnospiraceae bacterium]
MKRRNFFGAAAAAVMILLLSFPRLSLEGARNGLLLWYQTVLPTLLPFMVCTNLVVSMNGVGFLTAPIAPLLKRLLGISDSGCFVLLGGMLCGYPMGAKNCSEFLSQGCLSLPEARCLYAVSSFPSPMFLAGYMMAKASQSAGTALLVPLWKMAAAVYLPIFPMFYLASLLYGFHLESLKLQDKNGKAHRKAARTLSESVSRFPSLSLDEALMSSIEIMVKIGGYLMMFSILARFLKLLPIASPKLTCLLVSAAEMTTGMEETSKAVSGLSGVRLILAAGAFGGFSGVFQVKSVTKNAGLSIRHYILWKILHCGLACLILTLLLAFPR